jgi:hypothetical protein
MICNLDPREAVTAAVQSGFEFVGTINGGGSCVRSEDSFVVSAGPTSDVTCDIAWFGTRKLQNGWKLSSVTFVGAPYSIVKAAVPGSDSAEVRLRIRAPKGVSETISLNELKLTGAECHDWKLAF